MTEQFTPEQLRHVGCLALENHLLREAVLSWMDAQPWPEDGAPHKPRQEDAPMWKDSVQARQRLSRALDDACGFDEMIGGGRHRRRFKENECAA